MASAADAPDALLERLALDVLEDDVRLAVVLARVDHGDDVRVGELGDRARLAAEALELAGRSAISRCMSLTRPGARGSRRRPGRRSTCRRCQSGRRQPVPAVQLHADESAHSCVRPSRTTAGPSRCGFLLPTAWRPPCGFGAGGPLTCGSRVGMSARRRRREMFDPADIRATVMGERRGCPGTPRRVPSASSATIRVAGRSLRLDGPSRPGLPVAAGDVVVVVSGPDPVGGIGRSGVSPTAGLSAASIASSI